MTTQIQNFYKTTITRNWTATTGDFNVSVAPTISAGWLVVSPNNSTLREIVKYSVTGTNSYGPFITISNLADRGVGGTSAQTHTIGEAVRMNITAEHWADLNATIAAIVAQGAPDASTTTKGIAKLPRIVTSTSPSYAPVTAAGEQLILMVKGTVVNGYNSGLKTTTMKINGSTVDTCESEADTVSGRSTYHTISFLYLGVPGAQTNSITFDQTITNLKIISIII